MQQAAQEVWKARRAEPARSVTPVTSSVRETHGSSSAEDLPVNVTRPQPAQPRKPMITNVRSPSRQDARPAHQQGYALGPSESSCQQRAGANEYGTRVCGTNTQVIGKTPEAP